MAEQFGPRDLRQIYHDTSDVQNALMSQVPATGIVIGNRPLIPYTPALDTLLRIFRALLSTGVPLALHPHHPLVNVLYSDLGHDRVHDHAVKKVFLKYIYQAWHDDQALIVLRHEQMNTLKLEKLVRYVNPFYDYSLSTEKFDAHLFTSIPMSDEEIHSFKETKIQGSMLHLADEVNARLTFHGDEIALCQFPPYIRVCVKKKHKVEIPPYSFTLTGYDRGPEGGIRLHTYLYKLTIVWQCADVPEGRGDYCDTHRLPPDERPTDDHLLVIFSDVGTTFRMFYSRKRVCEPNEPDPELSPRRIEKFQKRVREYAEFLAGTRGD